MHRCAGRIAFHNQQRRSVLHFPQQVKTSRDATARVKALRTIRRNALKAPQGIINIAERHQYGITIKADA